MTGWYFNLGTTKTTKAHFVICRCRRGLPIRRVLPICGARIGKRMKFYTITLGFDDRYVECKHCLRIAKWATEK